jgi:hypothetical protein
MLAASGKHDRHHAFTRYERAKKRSKGISLVFEFPVGNQSPLGPPDSGRNIHSRVVRPQTGASFEEMVEQARIRFGLNHVI